nr:MAG: hypothetical protein DIU80_02570 [Chloroflexota bacterium]
MPQVRKLPPEEVRAIENKGKGKRKLTEEEYDRILADFNVGDYGEVIPDEGERRLTIRNRLKAAAKRCQVSLSFLRTRDNVIRFKVEPGDGQVDGGQAVQQKPQLRRHTEAETSAPPPVSSDAPPRRRGGRPKKKTA